ncbi:MAG: Acylneuraminate cytidylyltransferase [archaeon GW2011_AR20]|nr:MAG: Acylneuraminate cytidylyltransferase [archaeon GW2011_AR20]AQS28193.1 hypothetical protein [uncultured archaeon]MBS3160513.1 glycosyltransferase family protein [Candidatus Woesearchaeota archaeon]
MTNNKVGIIVQARTGSTRLPNKMIMDIEGKTLFEHIIERLTYTNYKNDIILATTNKERDDVLVDLSRKLNISHFRGSEDDVLERFLGATKQYNLDIIVRICGDNPFVDPKCINQMVKYLIENKVDYVGSHHEKGWPGGSGSEVITKEALFRIDDLCKDIRYREHVTLFAREHQDLFKTYNLDAPLYLLRPNLKLTVDTIEDLNFVRSIYKRLYHPKKFFELREVITLIDKEPSIISN